MAAKKPATKKPKAAKAAKPAKAPKSAPVPAGDANDHYNKGLRLIISMEGPLRNGQLTPADATVSEAETCLLTALKIAENHGRAHIMLGNLYRYTGRVEGAVPHFKRAMTLPPDLDDWVKACEGFASCHMMLNHGKEAIEALKLGIKHHPGDALFHFKLGACYVDEGRTADAKKALERTLELEPGHGGAQQLLQQVGGGAPAAAVPAEYAAKQKQVEKMAKDLQAKMMKLMSGPGSPEDKTKSSLKLQQEFQKKVQELYAG